MADYRCPKHDLVFEAETDQRKPGAPATTNLAAHPVNGHPDCPQCRKERGAAKTPQSAAVPRRVVSNV